MSHDWDAADIDVGNALSGLVEEEIVHAPDGALFAVPLGFLWRPAVDGALLESHLVVNDGPHTGSPGLASWRRRRAFRWWWEF